jgi:heat shock protein HslJ
MIKSALARLKFATLVAAISLCSSISCGADLTASAADSLEGSNWQLVRMTVLGGYVFTPDEPAKYVLNFRSDSRLTGTSDCNDLGGLWIQEDYALRFEPFNTSRKLCAPGSLHNNLALYLRNTKAFQIVNSNMLLSTATEGVILEFESR